MQQSRQNRGTTNTYPVWHGWRLLLRDLKLQAANVLRRAKLPGDLFARENAVLETPQLFELWTALEAEADASGERSPLPLRIASALSADWFDPALFAALCSADLNTALLRLAKYKRLVAPMMLQIDQEADRTTLSFEWLDKTVSPPAVLISFELVFFVQLARLATRSRVHPLAVFSPSGFNQVSEYEAYLGCKLSDGPIPSVSFSAQDAERPFLTSNYGMWSFFEPALSKRLHELDRQASMTERLRSVLLEAIPAGELSLESTCKKLGVSSRTLQRRLNDEGSSYQKTLDQVRSSLAQHYLAHTNMSGAEIAFLLGFEDPSSFVRAFQSWTGTSPQASRAANSTLYLP